MARLAPPSLRIFATFTSLVQRSPVDVNSDVSVCGCQPEGNTHFIAPFFFKAQVPEPPL